MKFLLSGDKQLIHNDIINKLQMKGGCTVTVLQLSKSYGAPFTWSRNTMRNIAPWNLGKDSISS